jgi:hypothetical protein
MNVHAHIGVRQSHQGTCRDPCKYTCEWESTEKEEHTEDVSIRKEGPSRVSRGHKNPPGAKGTSELCKL